MFKFDIPKSPVGFSFLDFANYVLDHSPAYETRAKMRRGGKAIDAIEAAIKADESSFVVDDDVAMEFQDAVEKTPIPRLYMVRNGQQGDAVPARFYTPFYEAVERGSLVSHKDNESNECS